MKTALLHYWLTNLRGGERVFRALCGLFPEGDVFTHALSRALRDSSGTDESARRWCGHPVRESFIARLPFGRRNPQVYLPLMPAACRALKLDGYELIVSSESGPIKGIRKPAGAKHVCYCHTPMRYLWDMYDDYYRRAGFGGRVAMRLFRDVLRREDLKSAETVDAFVANSAFVAERIRRLYGRDATVVHPFVDPVFFSAVGSPSDYYLLAGQLVSYKRPDLAVAACLKMNRRLKVIGTGNRIGELKALAAGNAKIEFLGHVDEAALRAAYAGAKALLFPGVEDFGIVPLEAQAAGTPVIAFGKGGALETVVDGRRTERDGTGLFFGEQTVASLCGAIEDFEGRSWRAAACRANAARFTEARFADGLRAVVQSVLR